MGCSFSGRADPPPTDSTATPPCVRGFFLPTPRSSGARTMSQTASQPSAVPAVDGVPPHRYTPALALEIELAWQDRWEREGTFHTPNPVGPMSDGFERVADRPKYFV